MCAVEVKMPQQERGEIDTEGEDNGFLQKILQTELLCESS